MTKQSVIAIALMMAGLAAIPSARAQMDCNAAYKTYWDRFNAERYASTSPEDLAEIHRKAVRAYDACQAGDEFNARAFFNSLGPTG